MTLKVFVRRNIRANDNSPENTGEKDPTLIILLNIIMMKEFKGRRCHEELVA